MPEFLEVDETALREFFGVPEVEQDIEEKEFFGASIFEVTRDGLSLTFSAATYHRDVIITLKSVKTGQDFVNVQVDEVEEVRIRDNGKRLFVMKRGERVSTDPTLLEAVTVTIDPIRVVVNWKQ